LAPDVSQPGTFELGPGETAEIGAVWRISAEQGPVSATLIASHGGLDHTLRATALIAEPPSPVESTGGSSATPTMEPTPHPKSVLSEQEKKELELRRPQEILYRLQPAGRLVDAVVTWKYQGPDPGKVSLEKNVVVANKAGLGDVSQRPFQVPGELPKPERIPLWVLVSTEENPIRILENGTRQCVVAGLEPGYHELRIVTQASPASKLIQPFTVRADRSPPNPLWKWLAAALGTISLLYLFRKKNRCPPL
jgi:hypothetical protein